MISLIVSIIFVALIFWLLIWLIDFIGIPEPFNKAARIIISLIAVIWLISVLLPFIGGTAVKPLNIQ